MCQPSGWHFYKRGTGYLPFTSKPHVHLQPEKGRKIARTDDQSVLAM